MDTATRQKIEDAIITAVAYGTKGFLGLMAVAFTFMALVCLTQIFREPFISAIGCGAFGFGAWVLWDTFLNAQTRRNGHEQL